MRERYEVLVGWSDHSPPEGVTDEASGRKISEDEILAVALGAGARFIEKHFTLDRKADDADSFFSHDPITLKHLVENVRQWEKALAPRKDIFEDEKPVWIWAKRSLVAAVDIQEGTPITREMLTSKRPGTGIRSKEYRKFLGAKAARMISKGSLIQRSDLAL